MKISALIITLATIAAIQSTFAPALKANQDKSKAEQARSELAAVLAQRDRAAEKQDIERFLSFYASDFAWRIKGGATLNRLETEQVLRLSLGLRILEHKQVSTIKDIKLRGDEAILEVEDYSFVKQELANASIMEATSKGQKRETWARTAQGWKLKRIDNPDVKGSQVSVDGQRVDPLKAPNHLAPPSPNVEDQAVLQAGNAIVFVYRTNDGTIVKAPVYCDEVKLAEMTGGSFIRAKLAPGKHSFFSEKGSTIDLNLESGKIYFLVLRLKAGFPKGRGLLEVDTSGAGPFAYKIPRLMQLKPLGRDNIEDVASVIMER